jgi:hypothetical protein
VLKLDGNKGDTALATPVAQSNEVFAAANWCRLCIEVLLGGHGEMGAEG